MRMHLAYNILWFNMNIYLILSCLSERVGALFWLYVCKWLLMKFLIFQILFFCIAELSENAHHINSVQQADMVATHVIFYWSLRSSYASSICDICGTCDVDETRWAMISRRIERMKEKIISICSIHWNTQYHTLHDLYPWIWTIGKNDKAISSIQRSTTNHILTYLFRIVHTFTTMNQIEVKIFSLSFCRVKMECSVPRFTYTHIRRDCVWFLDESIQITRNRMWNEISKLMWYELDPYLSIKFDVYHVSMWCDIAWARGALDILIYFQQSTIEERAFVDCRHW